MELAAIATAAVPGLTPVGVAGIPDDPDDFDSAVIVDGEKNRWRVRSPRHEESSMRLETELTALRSFTPRIRASLPFRLPSVAGTVRQGTLRTFVYNHLPGSVMDLDELVASGGATAEDIGRAIAAIHALPEELVDRADLPVYTAEEFRQRRLNELDQAATTGRIPPRLLRRWEHALEDVALWRFHPRVVHGDLHEENLLMESGKVAAVTGWTDVRIGDPADDFAWLAAAHEQSFTDSVLESYVAIRKDLADPHIMRRAALAAEFALAQWLSRGIATNDPERIAEGEEMLRDLDEDIAEYGGQPISIVEPPRMDAHGEALASDGAGAAEPAGQPAPGHDDAADAPGAAAPAAAAGHATAASGTDDTAHADTAQVGAAQVNAGSPEARGTTRPAAAPRERSGLPPRPATAPGTAAGHAGEQDGREAPAGTAGGAGQLSKHDDGALPHGKDAQERTARDTGGVNEPAAGNDADPDAREDAAPAASDAAPSAAEPAPAEPAPAGESAPSDQTASGGPAPSGPARPAEEPAAAASEAATSAIPLVVVESRTAESANSKDKGKESRG